MQQDKNLVNARNTTYAEGPEFTKPVSIDTWESFLLVSLLLQDEGINAAWQSCDLNLKDRGDWSELFK